MAPTDPPPFSAAALAARLPEYSTPRSLLTERLQIARQVADQSSRKEQVVAAIVVGSTAFERCSATADLDLILITPSIDHGASFETQIVSNVRVDIERITIAEASAKTGSDGWIWELREAARIGCGIPVYDPAGFAAELSRRAVALRPRPAEVEATLRDVRAILARIGVERNDMSWCEDALRGCLDNLSTLALLAQPRRYQKAKWVLADLLHAGQERLVDAMISAYRIESDAEASARATAAAVRILVETVHQECNSPSHEALLRMGYAPAFAEASYVSRTLADAEDLVAVGRNTEAQYVAKFAARLAIGQLNSPTLPGVTMSRFRTQGHPIQSHYRAIFRSVSKVDFERILPIVLQHSEEQARSIGVC